MEDLQNQIWFIKAMFHFIPVSNFTIKKKNSFPNWDNRTNYKTWMKQKSILTTERNGLRKSI